MLGCLQDWPHKWQSFIPDIVNASKTNETLCENSMHILKLLSEEVFDFSRGELTQVWRLHSIRAGFLAANPHSTALPHVYQCLKVDLAPALCHAAHRVRSCAYT
jgi:hypothetical protein